MVAMMGIMHVNVNVCICKTLLPFTILVALCPTTSGGREVYNGKVLLKGKRLIMNGIEQEAAGLRRVKRQGWDRLRLKNKC